MRPRIVEYLNNLTGTSIFQWLVPDPSIVYLLAVLLCGTVYVNRSRSSNLNPRLASHSALAGAVGAFLGAKLFFVVAHLESYLLQPSHIFAPGGTFSWGAYLGATAAILFYVRRRRESPLRYLDVFGSCLGLGPFIGRWSCLLNGDDYGTITSVPWAIQYPTGSIPFAAHINDGIIDFTALLSAPVHPNQLYLSLNGLALFFVVTWIWRKYHRHEGVTIGLYFLLYGISRFVLEYFRDETSSSLVPQLNPSQLFSLATVAASSLFLALVLTSRKSAFETTGERSTIGGESP